ncbi:tripartite tricarboxylate transporter permease [Spelaeicoccus albus]|uniref:Putative tricarboxylic transport membrane protein n=1 Tax=Spelaeicoccus albus TaxID=1280376 RepID=A0A7Z0ABG1_9MICO|nr:tripartite tricarboxylate transporter permease [Spelaeicoccus albus]NYI67128.1 putative tricarboxylic transport membrane protein [Spelaeicoccus albus]
MDLLTQFGDGLAAALTPANLMFAFAGVLIGTIIGILPGIGPITAIALLIPLSFGLEPAAGLVLMSGVYYGSMYGGSITSILINTPGEVSHVATTLEGYRMGKNGRAGPALATSAIGSFIGGTLSVVALMFLATALAQVAVLFGAAEYTLLLILALAMTSSLSTGSKTKAFMSTLFGMAIAIVGIDGQTSVPRFTFGSLQLDSGIGFALVAMALFAIPEALKNLAAGHTRPGEGVALQGRVWLNREDWRRSAGAYGRGSVIGFAAGLLPGLGPTLGSFMSYVAEKRFSKHKKEFDKDGAIEGVAGPESANNAGVGGAFVPMLALGIPGSATTALLLFVFEMYGLQPGPLLFHDNATLVWTIIASMYVGNIILLVLNLPLVKVFVRLLQVPPPLLYTSVLAFTVLGAYALNFSLFSMVLLFIFGLAGYFMQRYDFPLAPAILALVLEPLLEKYFRQAIKSAGGDFTTFVDGPMAITLAALIVVGLILPPMIRVFRWGVRTARNTDSRETESASR